MTSSESDPARDLPCDEFHEDDGIPFHRREPSHRSQRERKMRQLCKQIGDGIHYALAYLCDDQVLNTLALLSVEPTPGASHVRVFLGYDPAATACTEAEIEARLEQHKPWLRAEAAQAIHRRRVPEIALILMASTEGNA